MRSGIYGGIIAMVMLCAPALAYDWSANPGNGTPENPYQISTPEHLMAIGDDAALLDKHFILTSDIIFDPNNNPSHIFTTALIAPAIGISPNINFIGEPFIGCFNGNNFTISNIYIDSTISGNSFLGLFGEISDGSHVKNITLNNIFIEGNDSSSVLGGLCGSNKGFIINCSTSGIIQARLSYGATGGFCGINYGLISSSCSTCSVKSNARYYVGGLCARNEGAILNSYSSASVETGEGSYCVGNVCGINYGGVISNCYSVGSVRVGESSSNIGAFCGLNHYASIGGCYYLSASGPNNGNGTPLSETAMKQQVNFVGWDFLGESANGDNEIWRMCVDGVEYPRLSWEFARGGDFACGDGVDLADLQMLAGHWLAAGMADPAAFNGAVDANGDEVIDGADFAVLSANWLH